MGSFSARARPLLFVLPDGHTEISGGNLYNLRILSALRAQPALQLDVLDVARWRSVVRAGVPARIVVDSLLLETFKALQPPGHPQQAHVLLAHHLPSLEPDLDATDPSRLLEAEVLPAFQAYWATSEYAGEVLRRRGVRGPVIVVPPALDAPSPRASLFPSVPRGLMVCNLIRRKGVLPFLERLADVCGDDPFQLSIVGRADMDAAYAERCVSLVASRPALADRVRFCGALPHEAVQERYSQASVFLSASRMETYGMALQEARAAGLPLLVCRGGNAESHVEEGVTGHVVDDPRQLARSFVELVRAPRRLKALYQQAQVRARQTTERYSWRDAARRVLDQLPD